MKRLASVYVFLMLFMPVAHTAKAEVIFFDDSRYQAIVPPASARWIPGHSGGMCTSSTALPGDLCGPGTVTDESVWGYLRPPSPGATVDTDVAHYGALTPIPFNDFLWVTEPEHGHGIPGIFGDYLYSEVADPDLPYIMQLYIAIQLRRARRVRVHRHLPAHHRGERPDHGGLCKVERRKLRPDQV